MRDRARCRRSAALLLIVGLLLPGPAAAQVDPPPPSIFAAAFDLVLLRPLRAAQTVVGAVLFVPVGAVTAANGRDGLLEAWDRFVAEPARSVYDRRLGDF